MKTILKTVVSAAIIAASSIAAAADIKLTLGYNAMPGNPRDLGAQIFAKKVNELSKGRIEVRVAASAQLGDDPALVTGMRTGSIDLSPNVQGAVSAVVPEVNAFGMPFLFKNMEQAWKVIDNPELTAILEKKFDEKGLVLLGFMDQGIRHVSNSKKPLRTLADFKGLKIRTPADPVTVDIFRELGADPQQIKFPELYMALQQGVVQAQENPLANIESSKLYEVQPFISLTAHKWESSPFLMSKRSWQKLNATDQAAIREAAKVAITEQRNLSRQADDKLQEVLKKQGVTFDTIDIEPLRKATLPVIQKWENGPIGDFVKKVREVASKDQ